MLKRRLLLTFGVAALCLAATPVMADLTNGSFEATPDHMAGWTLTPNGGQISAVTVYYNGRGQTPAEWTPMDGSYFALLTAGTANTPVTLSQTFTVSAGHILTFNYFWDAGDVVVGGQYNDWAKATISLNSGSQVIVSKDILRGAGFILRAGSRRTAKPFVGIPEFLP